MWKSKTDAERVTEALSKRLSKLSRARRHLAAARDDEDHQARRLEDKLERHGWLHRDYQSQLSLLDAGRKLTGKALEKIDREIAELEARLAERGGRQT